MHKRFVILGDPHIREDEIALWDRAIKDINNLEPDGVLILGDLTGAPEVGSHEALSRALRVINNLQAPWYSIIGNHDLQHKEFASDKDAVNDWLSQVGRDTPWFSKDFGELNVIGLSNTKWRDNEFQHNEITTGDEQLQWLETELNELGEKPVLILGHTPPTGADIIKLNGLHLRVGNAFMNENHNPSKVQKIIHEHPNILFWFSGHNHMGQHYRDAITIKQGVHFVHTGVVSRNTSRDGQRNSRILDIYDDKIAIRTFNYATSKIDDTLEHIEPYGLDCLLNYRKAISGKSMVPRDPKTMHQGPDNRYVKPTVNSIRFAYLSDLHATCPLEKSKQQTLDWCRQVIKQRGIERVVLGGDMLKRSINPKCMDCILSEFFNGLPPTDYFVGNHEGEGFAINNENLEHIKLIDSNQLEFDNLPSNTFYLHTASKDTLSRAVKYLSDNFPKQGNVLIITHFPPELEIDAVNKLASKHPNQQIWWIAGHKHKDIRITENNLNIIISAGLDMDKTRNPALLIVDWDGEKIAIQRLEVPSIYLV